MAPSSKTARETAEKAIAARAECVNTLDETIAMVARHIDCEPKTTPSCDKLIFASNTNSLPYCPSCGWTLTAPKTTEEA